jgi:DNA helicase-2/ATP-dependent DNA helicase PcrA
MPDKFRDKNIFLAIYDVHTRIRQQEEPAFSEILTRLLKASGYLEFLEDRGEESRQMNIDELSEFIKKWETENPGETIGDLMDRITLDSDANSSKEKENNKNTCPVYLLTMHNAKGLEFPTVIVAGINASYMPFFMRKDKAEIEEERRLFYVAATRASKQLIVSVGGEKPSRFLGDVGRSLYSTIYSGDDIFQSENSIRPLPERGIEPQVLEEKYLEHPIFGQGKIIAAIDKDRYVVHFAKRGEKTIDTSIVPVTFL